MHHSVQHLPSVLQTVAPYIDKYGYYAVLGLVFLEDFGIPVPGETVLITAAFYAGVGQLNILLVIVVGFIAAIAGDNVGYIIGTYGGHPLVERYGRYVFLNKERIAKAEDYFNRHGGKVVVIARFVEGLRQLNGILAGMSEMTWSRFIIFNVIGAAFWVTLWTMVGYYSGNHIGTFLHYELYFTVGILAVLALFIAYKVFYKRIKNKS